MKPQDFLRQFGKYRIRVMKVSEYMEAYKEGYDRHDNPVLNKFDTMMIEIKAQRMVGDNYNDAYVVIIYGGREHDTYADWTYFYMDTPNKPTNDEAIDFLIKLIDENYIKFTHSESVWDIGETLNKLTTEYPDLDYTKFNFENFLARLYYTDKIADRFESFFCNGRIANVKELIKLYKKYCKDENNNK